MIDGCQLIGELNLSYYLGYTMWKVTFLVKGKKYAYEVNEPEYRSLRGLYARSKFKALNYAKKHGKSVKVEDHYGKDERSTKEHHSEGGEKASVCTVL